MNRGIGVFETMRCADEKIVGLDKHLARLKDSCELLKIKIAYSGGELKKAISKVARAHGADDLKIKLTVRAKGKQSGVLIYAKKYLPYSKNEYRSGFRIWVSPRRVDQDSDLWRIKSTSRAPYELAYKEAQKSGADEALLLNKKGDIAECSRSNIFWIKKGIIFTPAIDCGCLPGVTRQLMKELAFKEGLEVREGKFKLSRLLDCDEAFLTNSLIGIMPIEKCKKITKFLMEKYACLSK